MKSFCLTCLSTLVTVCLVEAQENDNVSLVVPRTTSAIKIDGLAEEEDWKLAETTTPFFNKWPSDSGYAEVEKEVRMLFYDQFI